MSPVPQQSTPPQQPLQAGRHGAAGVEGTTCLPAAVGSVQSCARAGGPIMPKLGNQGSPGRSGRLRKLADTTAQRALPAGQRAPAAPPMSQQFYRLNRAISCPDHSLPLLQAGHRGGSRCMPRLALALHTTLQPAAGARAVCRTPPRGRGVHHHKGARGRLMS